MFNPFALLFNYIKNKRTAEVFSYVSKLKTDVKAKELYEPHTELKVNLSDLLD